MRRRKKENDSQQSSWLATYSDMVTLLLCFFVLLFSFSTVDAQKFREIMNSFQGNLGVLEGGKTLDENTETGKDLDEVSEKDMEDLNELKKYLEEYAEENGLAEKILLEHDERGLIIRIMDSVFFDSGKAEIKFQAKEILMDIGEILNEKHVIEKHIKVEGHTDNVSMNSEEFPSNWELSVIRATNVLRLFVEETGISPDRISASGYGEFRPIAPNDTSKNKQKNRRVDIIVLNSDLDSSEPN
ncbi:OmpA family protein [Clostridium sp. D2Q-14]|uniref:flagellar motor protein MotB n=1 Tax=Anaeromonas gelatinilytica TaxID=2683194 RepID=UPI00193C6935|nr:flagellar motor protein MotB [Anaeromonas gelatinilytica]MBS4536044.1 OmpA family protein [Anaeromonas gelatinilytica]